MKTLLVFLLALIMSGFSANAKPHADETGLWDTDSTVWVTTYVEYKGGICFGHAWIYQDPVPFMGYHDPHYYHRGTQLEIVYDPIGTGNLRYNMDGFSERICSKCLRWENVEQRKYQHRYVSTWDSLRTYIKTLDSLGLLIK